MAAVPLALYSAQELAPVEDEGFAFLAINSAPDASLDYTAGHMDKVYAVGASLPEFEAMFEIVFPASGFGGYLFKDWHDRERSAHEILPEIFGKRLADRGAADLPGAAAGAAGRRQLRRRARPPGAGVGGGDARATPPSSSARRSRAASSSSPTPT